MIQEIKNNSTDEISYLFQNKNFIYFDYQRFYYDGRHIILSTSTDLMAEYKKDNQVPTWSELFTSIGPTFFSSYVPLPGYIEKESKHTQNIDNYNKTLFYYPKRRPSFTLWSWIEN